MPAFGPVYCETPGVFAGFPAEPINTLSNIALLLGLVALYSVWRKNPRAWDLHLLSALLFGVGVGSTLWHGLRLPWTLALDAAPGGLFFLTFALLWARRFYSWPRAALFFVLFAGAAFAAMYFGRRIGIAFFVPLVPVIVVFSAWLIAKTARVSREATWMAAGAIALAFAALTFRSIDQWSCGFTPFGTHFLWHIFLASAAFVGVQTLLQLDRPCARQPVGTKHPLA